jgi:hypothetical protein
MYNRGFFKKICIINYRYIPTETKVFEAKDAIANGADEIGNKLNNKSS